ncbi:MAG: hypothetical protein FJZ63_02275 [Chlamydiae bacterium]|nr:hypothetical protein [Chlamydiota bacterium]
MYKFLLSSIVLAVSLSGIYADDAMSSPPSDEQPAAPQAQPEQVLPQPQEGESDSQPSADQVPQGDEEESSSDTETTDEGSTPVSDIEQQPLETTPQQEPASPQSQDAASSTEDTSDVDDRLTQLEVEMQQVYMQDASGSAGALFASNMQRAQDYGWYIDAEFLMWHPKLGAMDWVLSLNQGVPPSVGDMIDLGFHWSPGFRVGFGKSFSHDLWDVDLLYTFYETSGKQNVGGPFITPAGTDSAAGVPGPSGSTSASYKTKIFYNVIDLAMRKHYFVSKRLSLHPLLGIKTVWLDVKDHLIANTYVNASQSFNSVTGTVLTDLKDVNKLWGIGPDGGMDVCFHLPKKMRLQTTVEGALLEGYFNVSQTQATTIIPVGSATTIDNISLRASTHRLVPYGRFLVGFAWGDYIARNRQHIDLSLNWEFNYFWRALQMLHQETTSSDPSETSTRLYFDRYSEDVGFYGLNLKIVYSF